MSHDEYKTLSICYTKYIHNYLSFTTITTDARKLPYYED